MKALKMKKIRFFVSFLIFSFSFFVFSQERKEKVILSADKIVEGNSKWGAFSAAEEDFEVKLEEVKNPKIEGEGSLKFSFKRLTTGFANKHARVEVRIPRGILNLLSTGGKCYLHVMSEKLPSSYYAYLLVESPYANSVIPLQNFDKSKGSFMAIEIDAKKIVELSKTTPKIDPTQITRIFLGFANVEKGEEGIVYVDAITDKPLAPVLNPEEKENKTVGSIEKLKTQYEVVPTFSDLKGQIPKIDVPIYVMEYHIWYTSPFGKGSRGGWTHWIGNYDFNIELPLNLSWRRNNGSIGYPLIGFYDSSVEEVIRWQIRCMKEAGFDGAFVQLYPTREDGTKFGEEDTIFSRILDICAKEGFSVGIHDEVQFRQGWSAQKVEISAERAGRIIKKFGKHPGFLKINGKPAYAFQCWDLWRNTITLDDLSFIFKKAEEISGQDIYWMPFISPSAHKGILSIKDVDAIVVTANSNFLHFNYGKEYIEGKIDWDGLEKFKLAPERGIKEEIKSSGKKVGLWVNPGFNNCVFGGDHKHWFDRSGGKTFIDVLKVYKEEKPDFIMVSSWNDWLENTAIEPGLFFDDYNGDPYIYCRIIAATKGKNFNPPPLPKPEAVDPWLHRLLYGIDRTPPFIGRIWYSPLEPAIEVDAFDQDSKIKEVKGLKYGNGMIRFPGKVETYKADLTFPSLSALEFETVKGKPGLSFLKNPVYVIEFEEVPSTEKIAENTWLHIYYFDGQPGRITIDYPAEPKIINFFESYPLLGIVPCTGSKQWREWLIRLRNLPKSQKISITLRFTPGKGKEEEKEPILLGSICLLSDFAQGISAVSRTVKENINVNSFKLNKILPDRSPYDWLFIQAEDSQGNLSIPVGVNLSETDKFQLTQLK